MTPCWSPPRPRKSAGSRNRDTLRPSPHVSRHTRYLRIFWFPALHVPFHKVSWLVTATRLPRCISAHKWLVEKMPIQYHHGFRRLCYSLHTIIFSSRASSPLLRAAPTTMRALQRGPAIIYGRTTAPGQRRRLMPMIELRAARTLLAARFCRLHSASRHAEY